MLQIVTVLEFLEYSFLRSCVKFGLIGIQSYYPLLLLKLPKDELRAKICRFEVNLNVYTVNMNYFDSISP